MSDHRAGAGQPELVGDHRVDQVGVRRGQDRPPAGHVEQRLAEALPEQPAVGLREQRLRDLVAAASRSTARVERVQPGVDAVLHVADGAAKNHDPSANMRHPIDDERQAVGRDVEQRQEGRRRTSATTPGRG